MIMRKIKRIIIIDADVVSHFISGSAIIHLPHIFSYKIKILDKVYAELERFPKRKKEVDNLLNMNLLQLMAFPEDNPEIKKEYAHIKKLMFKGDGEAACLAVVKHSKDILASSNLKDIAYYCKLHGIQYLTTMDFLCEALRNNIMDHTQCDEFIRKVIRAGGKLPVIRIKDYNCGQRISII